jgi:hypothetical protein
MPDRRETQWSGKDVALATGMGAAVLLVLAFSLTRGPLTKRKLCRRYLEEFQSDVAEGRIKYAGITEKLAREAGCSWPTKWVEREYG